MRLEDELKTQKFSSVYHKAILNIVFSAGVLRNRVAAVLKGYEISHEQYNVLRILRGQDGKFICMMDIASRMLDRSSNITRIVEKLINKELVLKQQSEADRREFLVQITKTGLKMLKKIDKDFEEQGVNGLPITEEEAETLNNILDKVRDFE